MEIRLSAPLVGYTTAQNLRTNFGTSYFFNRSYWRPFSQNLPEVLYNVVTPTSNAADSSIETNLIRPRAITSDCDLVENLLLTRNSR